MKNKLCGFISVLILLSLVLSASAGAVSISAFTDVKPSDWHYEAVKYVTSSGLFNGTSTTTFSPDTTMTRGMLVTVLGRLHDVSVSYGGTQSTPFNDVTQADYFFPYTIWANDNGIVYGIGNNRYNPHGEVTREQVAVILYRYAEKSGYGTELASEPSSSFPDISKVSNYAIDAVTWAVSHEILIGTNGILAPANNATRSQVAHAFMKFSTLNDSATPEPGASENLPDWENYNPTYAIPTGKSSTDADGGHFDYDLANEIMAQVNAVRIKNGVEAVQYNPRLQEWAGVRAVEQMSRIGHTRPDGSTYNTVGMGLSFENITNLRNVSHSEMNNTYELAARAVNNWYTSSAGHKEAMLSYAPSLASVSCYVRGNTVYIVELFSKQTLYYMDFLI